MSKILIDAVFHKDKVSQAGKPFVSCLIKTKDTNGNEVLLSGFGNQTTKSWVKGQTVDLTITAKESNGKTYYNFADVPERNVFTEIDQMKEMLGQILKAVTSNKDKESVDFEALASVYNSPTAPPVIAEEPRDDNAPDFLK